MNCVAIGKKLLKGPLLCLIHPGRFKSTHLGLLMLLLSAAVSSKAQPITLSLKEAAMESAFKQIQAQSGYQFVYTSETLREARPVTLSVKQAPLTQVLTLLFSHQPLSYQIQDQYIVVKTKEGNQDQPSVHEISGIITDQKGQPIQGATIVVKGKNKATATDSKGSFLIKDAQDNDILIITSIGYRRTEFPLQGQSHIFLQLTTEVSSLDETIVIAYGTTTTRLSTGNVSTIYSDRIEKQPVSNPLTALEALVPGLQIQEQSGVPGGNYTVQIRGLNSVRPEGNNPLFIVDGIPYPSTTLGNNYSTTGGVLPSPLNYLSPSDIESISVLKDADATAIYGSRGANGVILITTKKGKAGRTTLTLGTYQGWGTLPHRLKLLNTPEYLALRQEAFRNDGLTPNIFSAPDLLLWDTTRYTDWQKALLGGKANITDLQATVSGGNSLVHFIVGMNYHKEGMVLPSDFFDRKSSLHFSLENTSSNQKFTLSLSGNYLSDYRLIPQSEITRFAALAPNAPAIWDSTGNINWEHSTWVNPYSALLQTRKGVTSNLIGSLNLSYQITPALQLKSSFAYNLLALEETDLLPLESFKPIFGFTSGRTYFSENQLHSWVAEPQLSYQKKLGKGKLSALLGSTFQENLQNAHTLLGNGFSSDAQLENIQNASSLVVLNFNQVQYRYSALFGRLNYNWKEKYLLNATARRDGSSRFGPGKQFGNFGAVGMGWIFSKEKAVQEHLQFMSFGKLRFSYGITGNDQIGDYGYLDTYQSSGQSYQNIAALNPTGLTNPNYSWEKNQKLEIGLELGFLGNRIISKTSYYRNRSSNQLIGYPLPSITGFNLINANQDALVRNTGWELELTTLNCQGKNFSWTTVANLSVPRNKLIAFPNLEVSSFAGLYVIGQPLTIYKCYHYLGVDPATGIYQFEDYDKNGLINALDRQYYVSTAPKYYGGLENSLQWKSIQLSFFLAFSRTTNSSYISNFLLPGTLNFYRFSNQPTPVLDHWQYPGDVSSIQKLSQDFGSAASAAYDLLKGSDQYFSDASFVRLKNLALDYTLPKKWIDHLHAQSCRLTLQAQNLFTLTHYLGFDPETGGSMPPLRTICFGIQLTL